MSINESIVSIARSYVGQKEIAGNAGFEDQAFLKKMKAVGWQTQQAWCVYFAELVWKEAYQSETVLKELDALFSGSAVQTFKNFTGTRYTVSKEPRSGAIAIWQYGSSWKGHAAIVVSCTDKDFHTIDGNSNNGETREGVEVAKPKKYPLNRPFREKGLNLLGFIHPA